MPKQDLLNIAERCHHFWPREKSILLTGGTGFFGRWMVEAISMIEEQFCLQNKYIVTSRQFSEILQTKIPCLKKNYFEILTLDLNNPVNLDINVDYILHAATDVTNLKLSPKQESQSFQQSLQTILNWTKSTSFKKILYVSSGAVYEQTHDFGVIETDPIPSLNSSIYSESKKYAESEIQQHLKKSQYVIARCFSFLGPFVDENMIAMQMIYKKVKDETLVLNSPEAKRSYLYPTDLVTGLFTLLFSETQHSIYNLGSPEPIQLKELAEIINVNHMISENSAQRTALAGKFYYPKTDRLGSEFANLFTVKLESAVSRTIEFYNDMKVDQHAKV